MGIDRKLAFLLMQEAASRPFSGSILQLGKQDIAFSRPQLAAMARKAELSGGRQTSADAASTFVSDEEFFGFLGFSDVQSLDNSAFEGAGIIFDMNSKSVPDNLRNRFDVIFDGGTMEHVFDCPQFLANIFAMLKPGGRIIHFSPIFNHINHGFYFFSPTLFIDYYQANRFALHDVRVVKESLRFMRSVSHTCSCLDRQAYTKVDKLRGFSGIYYSFFVASKTAESRSDVIPQQGLYVAAWGDGETPRPVRPTALDGLKRLSGKSYAYYSAIQFLRVQVLNSWFYRRYVDRAVRWKRLPV